MYSAKEKYTHKKTEEQDSEKFLINTEFNKKEKNKENYTKIVKVEMGVRCVFCFVRFGYEFAVVQANMQLKVKYSIENVFWVRNGAPTWNVLYLDLRVL